MAGASPVVLSGVVTADGSSLGNPAETLPAETELVTSVLQLHVVTRGAVCSSHLGRGVATGPDGEGLTVLGGVVTAGGSSANAIGAADVGNDVVYYNHLIRPPPRPPPRPPARDRQAARGCLGTAFDSSPCWPFPDTAHPEACFDEISDGCNGWVQWVGAV